MNNVNRTTLKALVDTIVEQSIALEVDKQYRVEYAMQALGGIFADLARIEAWQTAVLTWVHDDRVMLDRAPRLQDFTGAGK